MRTQNAKWAQRRIAEQMEQLMKKSPFRFNRWKKPTGRTIYVYNSDGTPCGEFRGVRELNQTLEWAIPHKVRAVLDTGNMLQGKYFSRYSLFELSAPIFRKDNSQPMPQRRIAAYLRLLSEAINEVKSHAATYSWKNSNEEDLLDALKRIYVIADAIQGIPPFLTPTTSKKFDEEECLLSLKKLTADGVLLKAIKEVQ